MNNESDYKKVTMPTAISAIVPVFNEEQTVALVIEALLHSNVIDEVICVNDGSTDHSLAILKKYQDQIKLINLKKNQGKGYALAEGIKSAKNEIVAFIDADLTNLADEHIKALVKPILTGKFKAVLGYPSKGWMPDPFSNLTGERVYYKKDLVPHLEKMAKTRFGVEIFLNNLFTEDKIKKLPLKHLRGLFKYEKHDSITGLKELLVEAAEIAQEIGKREGLLPEINKLLSA
jgi:glycosyltransferase involved in cell wall biosynthesis